MYIILKKRIWVILLTFSFLILGAACYIIDTQNLFGSFENRIVKNCAFSVEAEGIEKDIQIWYEKTDQKFYLFVPSYMELSNIILDLPDHVKMYLDGKELNDGSNLSGYDYGKDYELYFSNIHKKTSLQLVETGGVATMYLDTSSGTMDKLREDRDAEEDGYVTFYSEEGKLDYSGRVDKIKGRGNTSWRATGKKPLSLKLSNKGDILGMGEGDKWVLINNFNEPSNLSNKLIYDFAKDVGLDYSPDSQLVDAYINGVYYGVYLLSEKNEIAENRVDVKSPTNEKGSSYLIDQDMSGRTKQKGDSSVRTEGRYCFSVVSPEDTSDSLKEEITTDLQSLENALYSEDGIDPDSGKSWDEIIDVDSWAKRYLIEEIFENVDAGRVSQFYYKTGIEGDDKIYAGPVWDYNSAFGNPHSGNDIHNPCCLRAGREWIDYKKLHNWYYYLYNQEKFYQRVVELYEDTFEPLLWKMINEKMPQWQEKIRLSTNANLRRWKTNIQSYDSTADNQIKTMEEFLSARLEFLHDDWIDGADYCYITALQNKKVNFRNYSILKGEVLKESDIITPKAPSEDKTFVGWYDFDTHEPYDFTQPVTKTYLNLYAKWK